MCDVPLALNKNDHGEDDTPRPIRAAHWGCILQCAGLGALATTLALDPALSLLDYHHDTWRNKDGAPGQAAASAPAPATPWRLARYNANGADTALFDRDDNLWLLRQPSGVSRIRRQTFSPATASTPPPCPPSGWTSPGSSAMC